MFSCYENSEKNLKNVQQTNDTIYKVQDLKVLWTEEIHDVYEIYVSNFNDTLINQTKRFTNKAIDSSSSNFYDLTWNKTEEKNVYNVSIIICNPIKFKQKNNKRIRTYIDVGYVEKDENSSYFTTKFFKNNDTLKFKYKNIDNEQIAGLIYYSMQIDTIIDGIKKVRIIEQPFILNNTNKFTYPYLIKNFEFYDKRKFSKNKLIK